MAIDPDNRVIALRIYPGLIKIIPVAPNGKLQEAYDVRYGAVGRAMGGGRLWLLDFSLCHLVFDGLSFFSPPSAWKSFQY